MMMKNEKEWKEKLGVGTDGGESCKLFNKNISPREMISGFESGVLQESVGKFVLGRTGK